MDQLQKDYPWTQSPLIAGAPMRLIAGAPLAVAISQAGGLGFIGAGNDASNLAATLQEAKTLLQTSSLPPSPTLPIGIGFLLWAGPSLLDTILPIISSTPPAAIWLFAPSTPADLATWTTAIRAATHNQTKIWIQIGTVADALAANRSCAPDVLVVQGQDAGGHGLLQTAGLLPLLPEIADALAPESHHPTLIATGGLVEGRGVAAALTLGAAGAVLGTRYLAAREAQIARGYQDAVLRASDGGVSTARGKLYDTLRGTTDWPEEYGGRGVLNASWHDAGRGMSVEENKRLYEHALGLGDDGWAEAEARLTTYAGSGVGLVRKVQGAEEITREVREEARGVVARMGRVWGIEG